MCNKYYFFLKPRGLHYLSREYSGRARLKTLCTEFQSLLFSLCEHQLPLPIISLKLTLITVKISHVSVNINICTWATSFASVVLINTC